MTEQMVQKKLALRSSNKDRMEDILDYDEDRILADDPPRSEKGKEGKKSHGHKSDATPSSILSLSQQSGKGKKPVRRELSDMD